MIANFIFLCQTWPGTTFRKIPSRNMSSKMTEVTVEIFKLKDLSAQTYYLMNLFAKDKDASIEPMLKDVIDANDFKPATWLKRAFGDWEKNPHLADWLAKIKKKMPICTCKQYLFVMGDRDRELVGAAADHTVVMAGNPTREDLLKSVRRMWAIEWLKSATPYDADSREKLKKISQWTPTDKTAEPSYGRVRWENNFKLALNALSLAPIMT